MVSDDGHLVVVFNGEIYNYPALRAELEGKGVRFRTTTDTEVLLHLYARYEAEMVHHLRGMFAFAIWDQLRWGVLLVRDPYGIKPLYTANDGWTFRFASQVKALLSGKQVSRDPEPAGIVGFHLFGSVPEPFTLYREIRLLPAGHTQWIDTAGPREPKSYCDITAILADGVRAPAPGRELPERLRVGVLDSVRSHLLADVDVGIFLSAGVDSGALLGFMREAYGQQDIRAITLAFDEFRGTDQDEAPLAAKVADRYDAHHIVRSVTEQEVRDDLPAILDAMDQPSIDGVNTWFVSKAASEAGLKVAVSGLGGDELLAGYPSFIDMPHWHRRYGALAAVPGFGRLARILITLLAPELARRRPKAASMFEYADSWGGTYLLQRGLHMPRELIGILDRDVAREGLRRLKPLRRLAASMTPDPGLDIARISALEASNYMRNQLLRDADWAGMAHSVEIRVPLVDVMLLRQVAPVIGALVPGAGKGALARAPLTPLPEEVLMRPKTGFEVPTDALLVADAVRGHQAPKPSHTRGLAARQWSQVVMGRFVAALPAPA